MNKRPYKKSICKNCKTIFSHRVDHPNKYCSRRCAGIARRNKPKKCLNCGKYYVVKWHHNRSKYCSRACSYGGRNKKRITFCKICRKKIERSPSLIGSHNFCSKQCHDFWQRTLTGNKTPNYKGGILIKDGYLFKLVARKKYYAIHRIKMEKHIGSFHPETLLFRGMGVVV